MASYANRYSATHRQWDHVGNLFPNVEHAEKEHGRLAGDFIPAPWLPVQLEDKHFEAWTVVSPGKIVALTRQAEELLSPVGDWEDSAHVVPAGLKVDWDAAAGGDTILTYTANDFDEKTIDLTTGEVYATDGTTNYTKTQVTNALRARGLVGASEDPEDFISYPVGVAAQAFYQWAALNGSKFNPADTKFHNFRLQHQVQILVSYQLRLPWIPAQDTSDAFSGTVTTAAFAAGSAPWGTIGLHSAARIKGLERYDDLTGTNFVAFSLDNFPLAGPTDDTPVACSDTAVFSRKRSGPDALTQAGDYYIDREVGVIFLFASGGGADGVTPANLAGETVSYWHYSGAPATVSVYASVASTATALRMGDFLVCDADSNFAIDTAPTAYDPYRMGQVTGFKTYPKDLVHKVKSQYTNLGNLNKMAGTATKGLPETLTYAGGADKEVVINLFTR